MTEIYTSVGPPQLPTADFYLGAWLVQPTLGIVAHDSVSAHLEPKAMLVLVCLAQHVGGVVTKDELLHTVWPDTFVSEHVLTHAIWQLRHALHDRDLIETVSRQGYRLRVPAQTESETTADEAFLAGVGEARSALVEKRRRARSLVATIQSGYALLAALLVVSFGTMAATALKEPALFTRHARLVAWGAAWLTALYSAVAVTAVAMWVGRRRIYAAYERWFCAFCPVNIVCGLLLLGGAVDMLYSRSSAAAVIVTLLLLPFILYAPFLQRRLVRRYHLGRA